MKYLATVFALFLSTIVLCQNNKGIWSVLNQKPTGSILENKQSLKNPKLFQLDFNQMKQLLVNTPNRFDTNSSEIKIVSFPTEEGNFEEFSVKEFTTMDPALAARFPEIKSYVGQGITHREAVIYFSTSPLGLQTMTINNDHSAVFIEPYTKDLSTYVVYNKADKVASLSKFECGIIDAMVQNNNLYNSTVARPNADDAVLRTYRLALSVTGEYTAYFGGTKALALAAMNNTMTRVNGVFEMDFGAHMNLIANNDIIIYTDAATDPYSVASTGATGVWNTELQNNLTNTIGNAAYDIGHLFGATGGGGNAGCIGCICVDDTASLTDKNKGSGYTSPADGIPSGDNFDIDYVAHEMGHQFGANHTFTHSNEGTIAQVEPGSGSTIMGYAGITSLDVQPHSDAYFHAVSIQQVTNNIKSKTCSVNTATGNSIPSVNAGLNYTIPKGTPFMLTGTATDANGDVLTYDWEQMDAQTTSAAPSATKTTGVDFRSYNPTTSPIRYFPRMETILTGGTTTAGSEIIVEASSNVARTFNFRLTVRDNHTGGPANNSADMVVTVNATAGPFAVTSPNTTVSYLGGSTQIITWNVAGTTANSVNCANVDILLSTNGGTTWSTLLAATPNDGSEPVTLPSVYGTTNRIMVKGSNHIFFDVSDSNFVITNAIDTTAPTAPTLVASGTTSTTTNLSWSGATDNVGVTGYDVYKNGILLGSTTSATTYAVTGLTASTTYSFIVKAKDAAGNISVASNTVSVTTSAFTYCTSQGNSIADEQIGRVQLGTIDNVSTGGTGYTDFTAVTTNLTRGTSQTITITPTWTSAVYSEGYAVFIDYNQNGIFTDSGETVWTKAASTQTPVSGTFTIPATATLGTTRMRVSLKYNGIPTACETFSYGQVEDYTLNILADTTPPSAPLGLTATGTTQRTTDLFWSASTDNVGVVGYDIYKNGSFLANVTTTSYTVTGLTYATSYTFSIVSKDAAGNSSNSSNTLNVTTLMPATTTITACGTYTWAINNQTYTVSGMYTAINSNGDTEFLNLTITTCSSLVNLKLFIEGYYDSSLHKMRAVKMNQGEGSSTTIVDNITVELHNSVTNALVASTTSTLQTNGTAVATFTPAVTGTYFIVVKHRNTIQTWSATPQSVGSSPLFYDFTNAANKAYGNNMKKLENGVYGFYTGDINQDGFIEALDYDSLNADTSAFVEGYFNTDLNGDGFVEALDYDSINFNTTNFVESSHP
jgi:chitodextrinase